MLIKNFRGLALSAMAVTTLLSSACTFEGGAARPTPQWVNSKWAFASLTNSYANDRYTLYTDSNFQVQQGASCTNASSAVSKDNSGRYVYGIRVDDSASIPNQYDTATVFLNGWRLVYRNKDHHVQAISSAITNIQVANNELSWSAGGVISDKNGDDGYTWCYNYTILFWKKGIFNIQADINHSDADAGLTFLSLDTSNSPTAHLLEVQHLDDQPVRPEAILPRGFGVIFHGGDDNHLLQFALKHGQLNTYAYNDGSGFGADWAFQTILKDKHTKHDYYAAQLLSVMSGNGVSVIHPPFIIEPLSPINANLGSSGIFSETFVVDNVSADYAVPMLTGWNLRSADSDRHIKDIGAWIESFEYTKDPDAESGVLTFTVKGVIEDKGGIDFTLKPEFQISILGLDRSRLITVPTNGPLNDVEAPSKPTNTNPQVNIVTPGSVNMSGAINK